MNNILMILLLGLMILVGGKRGLKSFLSLCLNFILLIIIFYLIALGFNPIIVSIIGCLIISYIVLYLVNGDNIKTRSSMKSIIIVLLILITLIFSITNVSRIAGFGYESYEEINMFSYNVNLDFTNISIALILIGLIGATIDSSIAISSALYEVHNNNKQLNQKDLYASGIKIGKDILGTTINTLFFAFLGEFTTLLIWFKGCNYSIIDIINAKTFCAEFIKIIFSCMGCILIIPLTSYITSFNLIRKQIEEKK